MACDFMVTGCRGQLGRDLVAGLGGEHSVCGVDLDEFDIRDREAVLRAVVAAEPKTVLHTAAYTDVDGCQGNRELAMAVNSDGAGHVAQACREVGASMVYYSTDYVFYGEADHPYSEEDKPNPQTVYGESKLAGEQAVQAVLDDYLILRIAWLYGRHGGNFVKTMLSLGDKQRRALQEGRDAPPLKVVNDQFGNPCWTRDVVRQTQRVLSKPLTGLFHATSEGETTWFELVRAIFESLNLEVALEPCTTAEFPLPAPRPHRSSLANRRLQELGLDTMPSWRSSLEEFLADHGKELLREM